MLTSQNPRVEITFPIQQKHTVSLKRKSEANPYSDTKANPTKRISIKSARKSKAKSEKVKTHKKVIKKKAKMSKLPTVIEINSSSSDSEDSHDDGKFIARR